MDIFSLNVCWTFFDPAKSNQIQKAILTDVFRQINGESVGLDLSGFSVTGYDVSYKGAHIGSISYPEKNGEHCIQFNPKKEFDKHEHQPN